MLRPLTVPYGCLPVSSSANKGSFLRGPACRLLTAPGAGGTRPTAGGHRAPPAATESPVGSLVGAARPRRGSAPRPQASWLRCPVRGRCYPGAPGAPPGKGAAPLRGGGGGGGPRADVTALPGTQPGFPHGFSRHPPLPPPLLPPFTARRRPAAGGGADPGTASEGQPPPPPP